MTLALDALYAITAERGCVLSLRRRPGTGTWVAFIGDGPAFAASASTANGAVRALADKLAPRPRLLLCQREETHG